MNMGTRLLLLCLIGTGCLCAAAPQTADLVDAFAVGDPTSEQAHAFRGQESAIVSQRGVPGRKILQPGSPAWQSAPLTFRMKVDPARRNYITVRFWGGDVTHDHLIMLIDGKQMGYMHLGDYDLLDYEACEPRDAKPETNPSPQYAGRFTYTTFLLPESATRGKKEIEVTIRATGKIWGYGQNFAQFQKNVSQNSRGIHGVFTHLNPYFAPETATALPPPAAAIPAPSPIDLDAVQARINREILKSLKSDPRRDAWRLPFLAEAYFVPWSRAYNNPQVVDFVVRAVDELARKFVKEPDKVVTRGSWIGCSVQASALILLADRWQPRLEESIDDGTGKQRPRRELWADMLEASVFQLVRDRRWLANQSQIVDNSGHRTNRALHLVDPKRGVPLDVTLRFAKESLGLLPWSHAINPDLSVFNPKNSPGKNYRELTRKNLSKEWGYVGNYGESTIWTSADIYESTLDRVGGKGDPELFKLMEDAAVARTIFRYPGVTADNRPVMRLEVYIDWRNAHFPGKPLYVGQNLDLRSIYYTRNPKLLAAFHAMIDDGILAQEVKNQLDPKNKKPDFHGLLHFPVRYAELIRSYRPGCGVMPMRGADFVFSDEEIGLVALKDGDNVFYAELYWRARRGINNLAKIHLVTPFAEHVATIHQEQQFIPTGKFSTEPDWVVYGFRGNRFNYPGGYYRQLRAGDKLPMAEHADDASYVGKAEFYRCSYGPYEIGMNSTRLGKSYPMTLPAGGSYRILPDGKTLRGGETIEVSPGTTIVLKKLEAAK